jgi:hypothetical protein
LKRIVYVTSFHLHNITSEDYCYHFHSIELGFIASLELEWDGLSEKSLLLSHFYQPYVLLLSVEIVPLSSTKTSTRGPRLISSSQGLGRVRVEGLPTKGTRLDLRESWAGLDPVWSGRLRGRNAGPMQTEREL